MRGILFIVLSVLLTQCRLENKEIKGIPKIVCTTTIVADAVKNVVGDKADVSVLMGPGVDPHEYASKPSDNKKLLEADIIVYHGLHLEGTLAEMLSNIEENKQSYTIDLAEGLNTSDLIASGSYQHTGHSHASYDPHIWNDVKLWKKSVSHLERELSGIKPEYKDIYEANAGKYMDQLTELDKQLIHIYNEIPSKSRVLITAHDAFAYLGRAYGLKVKSLQGFSTASEFGIHDVTKLSDFIIDKDLHALFLESSVPDRNLQAVIDHCEEKGHNVKIEGNLYSDALSDQNSQANTYIAMMLSNARTIVNGLK